MEGGVVNINFVTAWENWLHLFLFKPAKKKNTLRKLRKKIYKMLQKKTRLIALVLVALVQSLRRQVQVQRFTKAAGDWQ